MERPEFGSFLNLKPAMSFCSTAKGSARFMQLISVCTLTLALLTNGGCWLISNKQVVPVDEQCRAINPGLINSAVLRAELSCHAAKLAKAKTTLNQSSISSEEAKGLMEVYSTLIDWIREEGLLQGRLDHEYLSDPETLLDSLNEALNNLAIARDTQPNMEVPLNLSNSFKKTNQELIEAIRETTLKLAEHLKSNRASNKLDALSKEVTALPLQNLSSEPSTQRDRALRLAYLSLKVENITRTYSGSNLECIAQNPHSTLKLFTQVKDWLGKVKTQTEYDDVLYDISNEIDNNLLLAKQNLTSLAKKPSNENRRLLIGDLGRVAALLRIAAPYVEMLNPRPPIPKPTPAPSPAEPSNRPQNKTFKVDLQQLVA